MCTDHITVAEVWSVALLQRRDGAVGSKCGVRDTGRAPGNTWVTHPISVTPELETREVQVMTTKKLIPLN